MTKDEFIEMLMADFAKQQQIKTLQAQRLAEELALNDEYKVAECNTKKNNLAVRYTNLINDIRNS